MDIAMIPLALVEEFYRYTRKDALESFDMHVIVPGRASRILTH